MTIHQIGKGWVCPAARTALLLLAGLLLLPGSVRADNVSVNCDNFESLQAAINGLDPAEPNTIDVTGICQERVFIGNGFGVGYHGLVIRGPEGGTATITPPQGGEGRGTVMFICGSTAIHLQRLVLTGGARGLAVCDESDVDTNLLTIEGNARGGAVVFSNSVLFLSGATIRNNGQFGVATSSVFPAAVFLTAGGDDPASPTPTVVEGHTLFGVSLGFAGTGTILGPVQVRNNGSAGDPDSAGIRVTRNSALRVVANQFGNPEISGNAGHGILAKIGSSVTVGGATIANNTGAGIQVESLSAAEIEASNTIFGNGVANISCDTTSLVTGDLTGISAIQCANAERRSSTPGPPGGAQPSILDELLKRPR